MPSNRQLPFHAYSDRLQQSKQTVQKAPDGHRTYQPKPIYTNFRPSGTLKTASNNELPPHMKSSAKRVVYKPAEDKEETPETNDQENKTPFEQQNPFSPSIEFTESYRTKNNSFDTETSVSDEESLESSSNTQFKPESDQSEYEGAESAQLSNISPRNPSWKELQEIRIQKENLETKISLNEENKQNEAKAEPGIQESSPTNHCSVAGSKSEIAETMPFELCLNKKALESIHEQKYEDHKGSISKDLEDKKANPLTEELTKIPEPRVLEVPAIRYFKVTIREISSPSQFRFQFNHKALLSLMDELK
jgi:hypothetical protein